MLHSGFWLKRLGNRFYSRSFFMFPFLGNLEFNEYTRTIPHTYWHHHRTKYLFITHPALTHSTCRRAYISFPPYVRQIDSPEAFLRAFAGGSSKTKLLSTITKHAHDVDKSFAPIMHHVYMLYEFIRVCGGWCLIYCVNRMKILCSF